MIGNKYIGWFSGGVTSAVAIKVMIEFGFKVDIIYFETGQHHYDHSRFLRDCEKWYGQSIEIYKNQKYLNPIDVCRKTRYINGPSGARCTLEMKKNLRFEIEKGRDFEGQIFGFESDLKQINRAIRFEQQYPEAKAVFPLIELKMDKVACLDRITGDNIAIPAMYKLGYHNSNCIGCVKGGMGYWNKIRIDFPMIFEEMSKVEREVGHSCIKGVFLDELDPDRGRHQSLKLPECGVVCPVELDGLSEIHDLTKIQNKVFNI